MVNLKSDWLIMISLGGAVVSFYHVASWYIKCSPVSEPQILFGLY